MALRVVWHGLQLYLEDVLVYTDGKRVTTGPIFYGWAFYETVLRASGVRLRTI